jgi:hypothetical protein
MNARRAAVARGQGGGHPLPAGRAGGPLASAPSFVFVNQLTTYLTTPPT